MLHITNGDSVAGWLRQLYPSDTVLPWRDVLHEGPVPGGLSWHETAAVRAHFIADCEWVSLEKAHAMFDERDRLLERLRDYEGVILWFEHDLYDQLQLLQILDWFAGQDVTDTCLELICIADFPGVHPFHGLGQLNAEQLSTLDGERRPVGADQLAVARKGWAAYTSAAPDALLDLLDRDTVAMPFLRAALVRHLQQYPSTGDGLARTERQILGAAGQGAEYPAELFKEAEQREEAPFMGDATFWRYVKALCEESSALLACSEPPFSLPKGLEPPEDAFLAKRLTLTAHGRAVLAGEEDRVRLNGFDRWLGGVHLEGRETAWRWDDGAGTIVAVGDEG